eukprot:XP_011683717.1 PREDICTED: microfibril-associated glycoprotein 4-like [Strongylocentrotus purpuratus]
MPNRPQTDSTPTPDRLQTDFRPTPHRLHTDPRPTPDRLQTDPTPTPHRSQTDSTPTLDRLQTDSTSTPHRLIFDHWVLAIESPDSLGHGSDSCKPVVLDGKVVEQKTTYRVDGKRSFGKPGKPGSHQVQHLRSSPEVFPGEPQDCGDIKASGMNMSGIYGINPGGVGRPFNVYCDMDTAGGGWTVFQRRMDGSVDFNGNWSDYKKGFGSVSGEHWLGNDKIHRLTSEKTYELRVDIEDFSGRTSHASYGEFMIGNETMNYELKLGSYSGGSAGDSLGHHRGHQFSTKDRDEFCAIYYRSGWWFTQCLVCNLNGIYRDDRVHATPQVPGMRWETWLNDVNVLKGSEMKMRPLFG